MVRGRAAHNKPFWETLMERDANYVAVGAFTLLIIAMGVAFVMWYSDSGDTRSYLSYEIYFNGSVAGLTSGSPVRYLGVDVGSVRRITLNKERPDQVKVVAAVDADAPISGATRASLGLQGITGLLYINLKQVGDAPTTKLQNGERYPVIESQSSDIDAFIASLPQLAVRVTDLVDNINRVFSDGNVKALTATLTNLKNASDSLPNTQQQLQNLLAEFHGTSDEIKQLAANWNGLTSESRPQLREALAHFNEVSAKLAASADKLDQMMADSKTPLDHFTQQGLFELERAMTEARSAASEFRELSRSLKQTPSQLMFERPESGVEIKP
jgi:phospholipid/cholesterol/gamma-HCH transport system substrate-binding protein